MQLKLSSVLFAVLWTAGMLWWSRPLDPANIVITTICGVAVGYAWYRIMRWRAGRGLVPSRRR
jgi:hypothetical protein